MNRILNALIDIIKGLLFLGAVPELGNSPYFLGKTIYAVTHNILKSSCAM